MTQIQIYDTTLRDGTQSEGFTLSANDKVRVAQRLDELGVAFIEAAGPARIRRMWNSSSAPAICNGRTR